jgi:hypothetical protein
VAVPSIVPSTDILMETRVTARGRRIRHLVVLDGGREE